MHFTSPLNLLWAFPIGGLIVLMYILKLRRKDVIVSSTYLWRQVIRDVQANAPLQKLRKNILLFLQLITAALIIFALASPFLRTYSIGGRHIVLILDTSASMGATDVSPNRLEKAKQMALETVSSLHPGDMMMVLSAYSRPKTATGFTADRSELRRAISGLALHDTATNIKESITLASDLVASRAGSALGQIELYSDGAFETNPAPSPLSPTPNTLNPTPSSTPYPLSPTPYTLHPVGTAHDNVGITAVDFRRNLGSERTVQLIVVTHNYSDQPRKFNQEIYADDNLVDAHELSLPPNGEDTQPYDIPEPAAPVKMHIHLDISDQLAADNNAWLIFKPRKTLRVLLAGKENLFLENALKSDPSVDLSKTAQFSASKGFDVVVFHEVAPAHLPPGNYLFIHCTSDQSPVTTQGSVTNSSVADWEKDTPVLKYVDFGTDRFATALKASTARWARELAVGESGSLVAAGEKSGMRSEFIGFSITESLFPLRVAFPILISNSIRWLGTGDSDSELSQIAASSPITITVPPGIKKLTITRPDGSKREASIGEQGKAIFDETSLAGIYTASAPNFSYNFAANLASASESDITPHSLAPTPYALSPGHRVANNCDLIPWIALLALIVLTFEWYVFHRRIFAS